MEKEPVESIGAGVGPALAQMRVALDDLASAGWWQLRPEELSAAIEQLHRNENQVASLQIAALSEAIQRGLPMDDGAKSGAAWLRGLVPITPAVAATRGALAEGLPAAEMAPTRTALAEGRLSPGHARVVTRAMESLVDAGEDVVDASTRSEVQRLLVETAERLDPAQLGRAGRLVVSRLHPQGAEQLARDEDAQERAREAYLFQESSGMWRLFARLPAVSGAAVAAALDPLARPEPTSADGPDPRTARQRTADAVVRLAELSLAARPGTPGGLPTRATAPTRMVLTGDVTTLLADVTRRGGQAGAAPGSVDTGEPGGWLISPLALQTWGCEADVVPMLLDPGGRPLDVGDTQYAFPPKIRRAIGQRDQHCTFPGCSARSAWCHTHHLTSFARHGPTSEANGTLLCGRHHRYVHARGWIGDLADGHIVWRPPGDDEPVSNARFQEFEQLLKQLALRWLARNPHLRDTG